MGVAPLPADLRTPCQCTGGCNETWQGPQKRIWARWVQAIPLLFPDLAAGILMELVPASIGVQNCTWRPVTAFAPFILLTLVRTGQSPSTGTGGSYIVSGSDLLGQLYSAQFAFAPDNCESSKFIQEIVDTFVPPINSDVLLTPVRWYENANDVPH